jgi:hypothetical protein
MDEKLSQLILRVESENPPTRADIEQCYLDEVDETLSHLTNARELENATAYSALEGQLDELRHDLRESVQSITRETMWRIITKLRDGSDIREEEWKLIRLWVVGDAEAYVREENHYPLWIQELDHLSAEIKLLRSAPIEADTFEALHALLTDARGVARSTAIFLMDRERVQHFEKSIQDDFDTEARNMLADILVRLYESPTI